MKYTGLIFACVALFSVEAAPLIKSNAGKPIPESYIVVLKEGQSVANFQTKFDDIARRQNGRGRKPSISHKYEIISEFAVNVNTAALKELLAADEVEFVGQNQIVSINADQAGSGVTAYVIDTGINTGHVEFGGRTTMGANFINVSPNTDENGHGTHVAGTIGGKTFGAAKNVTLVGVKVLAADGRATFAEIVAGMDWVALRAHGAKAVVNVALGMVCGGKSRSPDAAADRILTPVLFLWSLLEMTRMLMLATDPPPVLKILSLITSTWIGLNTATKTISGTSMAAPHGSGIVALWLSSDSSLTSAQALYTKLKQTSTNNVITDNSRGSPNRLAFNAVSA
ncbi:hypothetical protein BG006_001917 [Podila minutissima]|uniref:Uncharacterized protein n=1 Tax=Podila minutissima TaxID=64525 RepID=A0A9P5VH07_9FUNG|nr:hypothetical protein BG006_001917 [Podila minutissima]